jgi:Rrf2 family nitric oxide-sensitive transcriptional repressor
MALVPCFAPIEANCAITPCCGLRTALKRATAAFTDVLDAYTLKDLARPRASLRALLSIAPPPRADAPRH